MEKHACIALPMADNIHEMEALYWGGNLRPRAFCSLFGLLEECIDGCCIVRYCNVYIPFRVHETINYPNDVLFERADAL